MRQLLTLTTVAIFVAGCSDPKAANEKNFKVAIQKNLDLAYPKCYVKANFPTTSPSSTETKVFQALVSAGLLSVKDEPRVTTNYFTKRVVIQPVYSLTDAGKKFYKADAGKDYSGNMIGGFCFGKASIKEISEFTEPADANGVRASRVQYTFSVSDFPSWAKLPETLAAMGILKTEVESEKTPIKSFDVLVLTNNGWTSQLGTLIH